MKTNMNMKIKIKEKMRCDFEGEDKWRNAGIKIMLLIIITSLMISSTWRLSGVRYCSMFISI